MDSKINKNYQFSIQNVIADIKILVTKVLSVGADVPPEYLKHIKNYESIADLEESKGMNRLRKSRPFAVTCDRNYSDRKKSQISSELEKISGEPALGLRQPKNNDDEEDEIDRANFKSMIYKSKSDEMGIKEYNKLQNLLKNTKFETDGCEHHGHFSGDNPSNSSKVSQQTEYRKYVIVPARPVICPFSLCKKMVGATGFVPHYEFDHPDISILAVNHGEQYSFSVNPDQISDDSYTYCVCLFILSTIGRTQYSKVDARSKDSPKTVIIPFTMMVSKLLVSVGSTVNEENCSNNHKLGKKKDLFLIVVWICGIETSPIIYYSLEATHNKYRTRTCIYSGPILSLNTAQEPDIILEKGECLILSPGLLSTLCDESGSLNINVIFH